MVISIPNVFWMLVAVYMDEKMCLYFFFVIILIRFMAFIHSLHIPNIMKLTCFPKLLMV